MQKLNVIIVDDEPLAIDVMTSHVSKIPQLHLVKTCSNAFEANEAINAHPIDLIFLDIQMPQLTGIDFLKSLTNPPMVIFTTAYSNYAIEGFELDAVDYLLKPISFERFLKSVNRAIDEHAKSTTTGKGTVAEKDADFIFIKADKKLIKVKYDDILYIEGLKDYVIIRLKDGSRVITLQTMKSLESKLPSDRFKRIHRSYIVGISKIEALVGNMIEVKEKGQIKHLPVGKNYRDELLALVNKNRL